MLPEIRFKQAPLRLFRGSGSNGSIPANSMSRREWLARVFVGSTALLSSLTPSASDSLATEPATEPHSRSNSPATGTPDDSRTQESSAKWATEWQHGNLHFHSDHHLNRRDVIAKELEGLRSELRNDLAVNLVDEPIHLIIFEKDQDYRSYMGHYFPEVPQRRALFIKRRGPGMVFTHTSRQLETDLRHETAHAMLNASLAYVPLWLDEGLAEYYEVTRDRQLTGSPHLTIVRIATLLGQVPEIESLESLGDLRSMQGAEYRNSWSWVHFLLNESDESKRILQRFLVDIQSGLPPGPLSRRVAADMPDYRNRYLQHFRRLF